MTSSDRENDERSADTARERLYAREIDDAMARVEAMEARLREVEQLSRENASAIRSHGTRIDRLRIDKQLTGLPRWLMNRARRKLNPDEPPPPTFAPDPKRLLLIAPKYPQEGSYGGQPVERRVRFYRDHGLDVAVFVPEPTPVARDTRNGVEVTRGPADEIPKLLASWAPGQICWHHPLPDLWPWVRSHVGNLPVHVWIHGFEARSWRELEFNYDSEEIAANRSRWDALEVDRKKLLGELFVEDRIGKVFVSEFMRGVAESFAGVSAGNSRVIHNVIDTDVFQNRKRDADARSKIVAIRSFAARNYGTDLIAGTIEALSRRDGFDKLDFEIHGDGKHFDEDTALLHKYPNVSLHKGVLDTAAMASIYSRKGILLVPTRWDSQGMTMGEGMAAGLVPVTNRVAAIPEFVDETAGVLAAPDDVEGLAEGISMLQSNPDRFLEMSRQAARRAREQCGPEATVAREVEMLKGTAKTPG